jgi:aminopeptidase N
MRTFVQHVLVFILLLLAACSFSQTTGYSGTGGNIDVNYYLCRWTIDPGVTKNIAGNVTIRFTTVQANVTTITLDLNSASFNNGSLSVTFHGTACGKAFSGNILTVTLPTPISTIGTVDEIVVNYSGGPPAATAQAIGYQKKTVNTKNMIYTLSESYEDRDWWPCKADMQDKADSLDIYVTTPLAYTAAANGVLTSTTVSGSNHTYYYKHRYPIASYLVAIAVSEYTINNRGTANINGTNMPVDYYYLSNRTPTATQLQTMDRCKDELVAFSSPSIFGDYPFKKEKYGMYEFGWGGGMEHQSFSAMGWSSMTNWSVIAHELMHQWFGDKVTFGTWNDLWLAEGFASYGESLAAELVNALSQSPASVRLSFKNAATTSAASGGCADYSCYIPNSAITTSDVLWSSVYGNSVYQRGAMVVSMLRKLAGDTKFFQACRNYLNDAALAYKSATSVDLKNHFETVLGYDLDPFFNDYVYGTGYPTYTVKWGNNGARINIELTSQSKTLAGATTYFRTPVVLTISNGTKDTTVVIYDQNGVVSYAGNGILKTISGNRVGYNLSFVPTSISFDLYNETLAKGSVSFNSALNNVVISVLDVKIVDFKGTEREDGNLLSLSIAPTGDKATFTLERSEDGAHFSSIGNMENEINTPDGINYSFLDSKILRYQTYYYRVKAVDDKGQVTYSKTISISRQNIESDIIVSPNPASNYLNISLPASWQNKQVQYTIYSTNGMVIKKERIIAGTNIKIAMGNISSGSYTIELNNDNSKLSKKFAVVH